MSQPCAGGANALAEAESKGSYQFGIKPEHEGRSEVILCLGEKISKLQREDELTRREAEKQAFEKSIPPEVM